MSHAKQERLTPKLPAQMISGLQRRPTMLRDFTSEQFMAANDLSFIILTQPID
jgi:hypothetical protein